jgi:phosphatidylglycerophosphate synthase
VAYTREWSNQTDKNRRGDLDMQTGGGRRPLKVREVGFSKKFARWLSQKNITPNSISMLSVIFAALAALCLFALPDASGVGQWLLPVSSALFIQLRLLCNLFDGMVAVEGGKGTPSGELFNDIPDRVADPLILVSVGYGVTVVELGGALGWCAALLAVMTAYVRTLSVSIGAPADFRGPMAKQHRMALITGACLLTGVEAFFWPQGYVFLVALLLVILGSLVTLFRRVRAAYVFLESSNG